LIGRLDGTARGGKTVMRVLDERDERVWYVYAQERAWGPYSEARVEAFVDEGRVAPSTLIAEDPEGPFTPAGEAEALGHLFRPQSPTSGGARTLAPEPSDRYGDPIHQQPGAPRPLLVFANLGAMDMATFEAALGIHGPFERIGRGLWLVRARLGAAGLRNALSRRMRGGDALLVVESSLEQAAWFNLDQAEERRLRDLWLG
jgi:hypothetical protein